MTGGILGGWKDMVMELRFLPFHKLGHERAVFLDDYFLRDGPQVLEEEVPGIILAKGWLLLLLP